MNPKAALRINFVGMVFALAIGEVALEVGKFYTAGYSLRHYPYVLTHLLLATVIISMSWVGWQKSQSVGNNLEIESIFSIPFVMLLIDIFLVVCYFIVALRVECFSVSSSATGLNMGQPDLDPEMLWTVVIFVTYVIWDAVTKLLDLRIKNASNTAGNALSYSYRLDFVAFFKRGGYTMACLLVAILLRRLLPQPMPGDVHAVCKVMLADVALIALFVWFRGLKQRLESNYKMKRTQFEETFALSSDAKNSITTIFGQSADLIIIDKRRYLKFFMYKALPPLIIAISVIWFRALS